jgi:hypothetical protein
MDITSIAIGKPPPIELIYNRLFCFIENVLPNFEVYSLKEDGNKVTSEDDITEDLTDYFEAKQEALKQDVNSSFKFTYLSRRKTDIGVKLGRGYNATNRDLFCWIEAKRLPTPKNHNRDEREYVFVSQVKINGKKKYKGNGGIQRFKENQHAANLHYSIMIGYIQEEDANYWLGKINGWITELINADPAFWNEQDYLVKFSDKTDRYISVHNRKDNIDAQCELITLHHFWIKI